MDTELTITTERIDDVVLLLEVMKRVELPELLDRSLQRHGLSQQELSWGWITTIWLAHILSQGDHRKVTVREWVRQAQTTLAAVTGLTIREEDFTDDRLGLLLRRLSKLATWHTIERDLGRNIVRVYRLPTQTVRLDATTVSGYHTGEQGELLQFGQSKDDPTLRQLKVMVGTLDPLGLPLVTDVVSGERADDPLYIPAVQRIVELLAATGLLFVGDCKMSALQTRAHIQRLGQYYLSPLALTGNTPEALAEWVQTALDNPQLLQPVTRSTEHDEVEVLAQGYTLTRECTATLEEWTGSWQERVFVVHSPNYAAAQWQGLDKRLHSATTALLGLTPPPGRGKRQYRDEAALLKAADAILKTHRVEGLLHYRVVRHEQRTLRYIGRGRGGEQRPTREIIQIRYEITAVEPQDEAIAALRKTLGWRAYVTNAPADALSLEQAVLTYRHEWRIERNFHRLKGAPLSLNPLFVKRDDQIAGLTHLLTLAVRFLTLIEFDVRRQLQDQREKLVGLHAENPKKATDTPTTERLLKAFDNITLTIVHLPGQIIHHVTPLTSLQSRILELLGLSPTTYSALATIRQT
jgi:transposase